MDRPLPHNPTEHLEQTSASFVHHLREGLAAGPDEYLKNLKIMYSDSKAGDMLTQVSIVIEPRDLALPFDETRPAGTAFYRGGLLGLRVAQELVKGDFLTKVSEVLIPLPGSMNDESIDIQTRTHNVAGAVIGLGMEGYDLSIARPYHDMFDEWDDVLCPDVRVQHFVRCGFGFVLRQANEAARQQDIESMQQALIDGIDIDAELARFFGDS